MDFLYSGLNELLFFQMFTAGESLPPEDEEQLQRRTHRECPEAFQLGESRGVAAKPCANPQAEDRPHLHQALHPGLQLTRPATWRYCRRHDAQCILPNRAEGKTVDLGHHRPGPAGPPRDGLRRFRGKPAQGPGPGELRLQHERAVGSIPGGGGLPGSLSSKHLPGAHGGQRRSSAGLHGGRSARGACSQGWQGRASLPIPVAPREQRDPEKIRGDRGVDLAGRSLAAAPYPSRIRASLPTLRWPCARSAPGPACAAQGGQSREPQPPHDRRLRKIQIA